MNSNSDNRKQLQLVTIMTGVMVPIIIVLAVIQNYYLLGVAVVIELALIAWSVALVRATKQGSPKVGSRE
ncbi:MAG: hypothetical protein Q4E01_03585 [Actinomycetaceae bacterium]|nr:hypothetical protein [Actinomycetaceae bacterium]